LGLIGIICCTLPAIAQSESTLATPADIRALLQASGTGDIPSQVGPVVAQQIITGLRRTNPNLSEHLEQVIVTEVVTYMQKRAEQDHVIDRLIPIYSKYLTKNDVRQLTDFYRSAVGRKLVSLIPQITIDTARVGREWTESILPELQTHLIDRLKNEKLID